MTMNRRDFFKVLGAAVALPAMNLKGLLKDEKEMEFHIYTSRPEPVMAELLGQLGRELGGGVTLFSLNGEGELLKNRLAGRKVSGLNVGSKDPLWRRLSGSGTVAMLGARPVAQTASGITLLSGTRLMDPRRGAFSALSGKIYGEPFGDTELTLRVNSLESNLVGRKGEKAVVSVDGRSYGTLSLLKDGEMRVRSSWGEMKLVSRSGRIWAEESGCRNRLCVHKGAIGNAGQKILCAPQRIVVEIPGPSLVDAIVG